MPKIFEKEGYRFFFYGNEHSPIHVHVRHGAGEAVFAIDPEVDLREAVALNTRQLSRVKELINEHVEVIRQAWHEHFR
jgi:hypothetical protein